jgi:hypothetical protein
MGLHRALAHKKFLGDLAVAQAPCDQFKDLKLTASDMEVFTFSFVRDERSLGRDGNLPHNNCLVFCCEPETKPDAKNGKGRGDQSAVDLVKISLLGPVCDKLFSCALFGIFSPKSSRNGGAL